MVLIKLNKWILCLAILAGVLCFSGYTESQIKTAYNQSELVVEKPTSKSSIYYYRTIKTISNSMDYYEFFFQSLLNHHNLKTDLIINTNNFICLQYLNLHHFKALINNLNRDDYHDIFIG